MDVATAADADVSTANTGAATDAGAATMAQLKQCYGESAMSRAEKSVEDRQGCRFGISSHVGKQRKRLN